MEVGKSRVQRFCMPVCCDATLSLMRKKRIRPSAGVEIRVTKQVQALLNSSQDEERFNV
jgi:hypothetical protein